MGQPVIEVENLVVQYGKGSRVVQAVRGISFSIEPGETVGFIGANGAGKSTTIKCLMGFIFPTSGSARVFGLSAGAASSRERIGYLPEVALYYPYMKARELLELYGGLHGLSNRELKVKIPEILEKVGLGGRAETLLRNFSKGMQQRLGIAQALIADPEALILDELSSGLDPLGRHDLRQVLLELKERKRTIFFSSHELTEVESLCDRVIMIHQGRIVTRADVADLMKPLHQYEIFFRIPDGGNPPAGIVVQKQADGRFRTVLDDVETYSRVLSELNAGGAVVENTSSRNRSLEEYFIDLIGGKREESQ
jgi:ABC-2 type transport system ATP-binding protein